VLASTTELFLIFTICTEKNACASHNEKNDADISFAGAPEKIPTPRCPSHLNAEHEDIYPDWGQFLNSHRQKTFFYKISFFLLIKH